MPRKPSDTEFVTFSVRMPTSLRLRLEAIAKEQGLEVSQLIRYACDALVRYYDLHDGVLHLPITFTQLWKCIDQEALAKMRRPHTDGLLREDSPVGE